MKRFLLLVQCLAPAFLFTAPLAYSQYQTDCGNNDMTDPGDTGSEDPEDGSGDDDVGDPISLHKSNLHRLYVLSCTRPRSPESSRKR